MRPRSRLLLLALLLRCIAAVTCRRAGPRLRGGGGLGGRRPGRRRSRRVQMVSREDAESNARLMGALFGSAEEAADAAEHDQSVSSHLKVHRDEDGDLVQLRFVYVDEVDCIGCTYCAGVARNTFFMEEEAGRARAFLQGGDDPEVIAEAIECCPVNCINYVDYENLEILEKERDGDGVVLRPKGCGGPQQVETKSTHGCGSLTTCINCPSRGCLECPMYGVGQNPNYIARLEERERKREASGAAAAEREEEERATLVDALFDSGDADGGDVVDPLAEAEARNQQAAGEPVAAEKGAGNAAAFDTLFADDYFIPPEPP
mmetsp:Transcript_20475/g.65996  ORF Transcript_20475/g.65996 Transcript_20475/m.65996 type:complete len:318 (+) Transcript_20475:103-1056(+)